MNLNEVVAAYPALAELPVAIRDPRTSECHYVASGTAKIFKETDTDPTSPYYGKQILVLTF